MTDLQRWRCPEGHEQLIGSGEMKPGPIHAGFCPECGPTIVELQHQCTIPQDRDEYPWQCGECGRKWELTPRTKSRT